MTVVDPPTPTSEAVHVLEMADAVKTSDCEVFTVWMLAVVVTDPPGPVAPCVVTVIGPELNSVAGPYCTLPVSDDAVTGTAEPDAGNVTAGAGPRTLNGPPNKLTFPKKP